MADLIRCPRMVRRALEVIADAIADDSKLHVVKRRVPPDALA
jgi:hypothetical protein